MSKHGCTRIAGLAASAVLFAGVAMAQSGGMNGGGGGGQAGGMNNPNSSMQNQQQMQNMQMGNSTSGSPSSQDRMFAKKALEGGMVEIQAAQLALTKSNSDDVKQYAQKMIDDHTQLADHMKPIAAQVGVQPPANLMPKDQAMITKLQGMQGADFDKAYIKDMVKDHKEDDKEFQMEASMGSNPDEKAAAQQGDTIIKQHLEMIQNIAKAHNVM